jgi:hypothetical protein
MIERIESIKLLKTLKGTDEEGKPTYWYAGEVYYPDKKPVPQSVLQELSTKRKGGSILEIKYKPESPPPVKEPANEPEKEKESEEDPVIPPDDDKDEKSKEDPPVKLLRRKK